MLLAKLLTNGLDGTLCPVALFRLVFKIQDDDIKSLCVTDVLVLFPINGTVGLVSFFLFFIKPTPPF